MEEETSSLFEVKNIGKSFEDSQGKVTHVLKKIEFELNPDEVVAVIGPSGCGKSTLLRIIAGLISPTTGEILYHNKKLEGLMPSVSFVFQNFALYPWMTVQENIEMALKAIKEPTEEIKKKTKEAIALIGLDGFDNEYPREISGGMKQRVGIARALVRNPEMLFMDEPFSNLDTFTAEALRAEVLKIWADKKWGIKSILLVSHDINEVAYMADRIIVLSTEPGAIYAILENKIPHPRHYHDAKFLKLVKKLHDLYAKIAPHHHKPKKRKKNK